MKSTSRKVVNKKPTPDSCALIKNIIVSWLKSNSISFTIFSSSNESSYFTKYQFEKHYNLQKIISSSQLLDSKIFLSLWINITYLIHHLNWFHFIDFWNCALFNNCKFSLTSDFNLCILFSVEKCIRQVNSVFEIHLYREISG